ncbi:hypothetical protein ACFQ0O_41935 [Saccharopolyspora spinosporotrichia]
MAGIEEIRANLSAATTQASEALYALKQAALTINEVQRALDTTVASSARSRPSTPSARSTRRSARPNRPKSW